MKKIAFYTLGCKVNQYETNGMIQKFKEKNYEIVDFSEIADLYVINTCTVTSIADRKSRQFIRQAKKRNPKAKVIAVGCYVDVNKEELEKIPEIDLCIRNKEKINIVDIIENNYKTENEEYCEFGSITYTEKVRAVIKVQDGCNNFCSYCIIPYARGRIISRKPENVIEEIKQISKKGIKEVVITGIHVASYGKDFKEKFDLIDLITEIDSINGIERIRLGSIEPKLLNNENLKRMQKIKKLCHHFHLSLQSGCTDTLKRMNRKYTAEEFEKIVQNTRNIFPDCILTPDIIVGFPGETEKEFDETNMFLKKIKFFRMHIFKYSIRKGTVAEKMNNQILSELKEERSNILLKLSDENELYYLKQQIGKNVKVLFEEFKNGTYKGHTDNFILVKVKSEDNLINTIKTVLIENVDNNELVGKVIQM